MTIRKDQPWGAPGALPSDGVVVRSDRELQSVITQARRAGVPIPTIGLLGGDLCRTVGGTGDADRLHTSEAMTLTIDVGAALIDGRLHWFGAHLVAKHSWWTGRFVVAMNAQYLGQWDVAPRGHPNDGRLDVLDGNLPLGQRLQARRRLPLGTHVPHPRIDECRVTAIQLEFDRPTPIEIDGEPLGVASVVSIRVEPDAMRIVI